MVRSRRHGPAPVYPQDAQLEHGTCPAVRGAQRQNVPVLEQLVRHDVPALRFGNAGLKRFIIKAGIAAQKQQVQLARPALDGHLRAVRPPQAGGDAVVA